MKELDVLSRAWYAWSMMKTQNTAETIQNLVVQIVELVAPRQILLFGSRARDEESERSDIDLCVVIDPALSRQETARTLYRELHGGGMDFDLVVATPADLERGKSLPGTVYRDIVRDGKTLYVA